MIVIGGGNVAMDVARSAAREVLRQHTPGVEHQEPSQENVEAVATKEMVDISLSALRMGAREVHLVCLEKREQMPAAIEEIAEAEEEGILLHPGLGPKRLVGENGKLTGLEVLKTKWVFDETGRFNPAFYENSETVLDCDTVIMAIGQAPRLDFLTAEDGVEISRRGLIAVNTETLMTSAAGVFAGGDCVFGPRLIIDSVADGKRAAVGIDEFLRGRKHPEPTVSVEVLQRYSMPSYLLELIRQPIPTVPLERRTGLDRSGAGVRREDGAGRGAALPALLGEYRLRRAISRTEACAFCAAGCVDVCPENCLELVSLDRVQFQPELVEQLARERSSAECGTGRRQGRRTGGSCRLGDVEGRDPLYPLRAVRGALSGGNDHDGVVHADIGRTYGTDLDRRDQCALSDSRREREVRRAMDEGRKPGGAGNQPPGFFCEARNRVAGAGGGGNAELRLPVHVAECAVRAFADRECGQR